MQSLVFLQQANVNLESAAIYTNRARARSQTFSFESHCGRAQHNYRNIFSRIAHFALSSSTFRAFLRYLCVCE